MVIPILSYIVLVILSYLCFFKSRFMAFGIYFISKLSLSSSMFLLLLGVHFLSLGRAYFGLLYWFDHYSIEKIILRRASICTDRLTHLNSLTFSGFIHFGPYLLFIILCLSLLSCILVGCYFAITSFTVIYRPSTVKYRIYAEE